jgi:hypothetical protein
MATQKRQIRRDSFKQKLQARICYKLTVHIDPVVRHCIAVSPLSLLQEAHCLATLEDPQASSRDSIHPWARIPHITSYEAYTGCKRVAI